MFRDLFAAIRFAATTAAVLSLGIACAHRKSDRDQAPPPVPVTVAEAVSMDVPRTLASFGNVEAYNTINVTSQVGGVLAERYFEDGQVVQKGQKLLLIDPRPFEAALEQAKANLARDRAQAQLAEREAKRLQTLFDKQAATRDELDTALTNAAATAASADASQAAVRSAQLQLGYTQIHSPVDGVAGALLIEVGNVVKANDSALVTINQVHPIYVTFTLPQQSLQLVRVAQERGPLEVLAAPPHNGRFTQSGRLTFINNQVNVLTGTIQMRGTFPNQSNYLWPGDFVNVQLVLEVQRGAVVVPSAAVQASQQGESVFVIDAAGAAAVVPVVVERQVGEASVIRSGLSAGQTVVTDGQLRLTPGAKVQIVGRTPTPRIDQATSAPASQAATSALPRPERRP